MEISITFSSEMDKILDPSGEIVKNLRKSKLSSDFDCKSLDHTGVIASP
jgi:hypothetical protein